MLKRLIKKYIFSWRKSFASEPYIDIYTFFNYFVFLYIAQPKLFFFFIMHC